MRDTMKCVYRPLKCAVVVIIIKNIIKSVVMKPI